MAAHSQAVHEYNQSLPAKTDLGFNDRATMQSTIQPKTLL